MPIIVGAGGDVRVASVRETIPEMEANGYLIAAAPDLYEALDHMMQLIDNGVLVRDTSKDAETGWALHQLPLLMTLKSAQSALAAARGEKTEVRLWPGQTKTTAKSDGCSGTRMNRT